MTPLYQVWIELNSGVWTRSLNSDYSNVELPSAWAKDYAYGLAKKLKLRTEVRNKNSKVRASFEVPA